MSLNLELPSLSNFGIGLRPQHYHDFLNGKPKIDWIEVHTENYFGEGGWGLHVLETLRRDYPVSLHGVGLGLGSVHSVDSISAQHISKIAQLVQRIQPTLISEHLCWNAIGQHYLNDLLPLHFTTETLTFICDRVDALQNTLTRPILIENVSTFLRFREDTLSETAFLAEVAQRTGCGILLDINNLYVNQHNHGENAYEVIMALPAHTIAEIHLAGHQIVDDTAIDHHGDRISPEVWDLYATAISRFGLVPTLIEWDTQLPALSVLLEEAEKARVVAHNVLNTVSRHVA